MIILAIVIFILMVVQNIFMFNSKNKSQLRAISTNVKFARDTHSDICCTIISLFNILLIFLINKL